MELLLGAREREAARLNAASDTEDLLATAAAAAAPSPPPPPPPPAAAAAAAAAADKNGPESSDTNPAALHAAPMAAAETETEAEVEVEAVANEVVLVLPREKCATTQADEGGRPSVIGVRFATLTTDGSNGADSNPGKGTTPSTNALGSPNALRVGGVVSHSARHFLLSRSVPHKVQH